MDKFLGILIRAAVAYLYLLLVVRLSGKRTIVQGTAFDLVVAFIISDLPDDIIFGFVPVAQGLTAITTVMLVHLLVVYSAYKSRRFARLVEPGPSLIVKQGRLLRAEMARDHLSTAELEAQLRLAQIARHKDVAEAHLEANGQLSVRRVEDAKPAVKRDRAHLLQSGT